MVFNKNGNNTFREVCSIELHVDKARKCVDIWLTRAEASNPELHARLRELYRSYKSGKYTVAVFCSGEEDLAATTGSLLVSNRMRLAEQARD